MGQVLQDDRAAGQGGRLGYDLPGRGARYRELSEDLVQPLGRSELGQLGVDDERVHGFGDLDELRLPLQHDQRQLMVGRGGDQRRRQAPRIAGAELDPERADADRGQLGHVPAEAGRVVRQRDAGREHQLAAAQQMGSLRQLDHVHPAHRRAEPVAACEHPRGAAAHRIECQYLRHCGQHVPVPPDGHRQPGQAASRLYTLSLTGPSCLT